MMTLTALLLLQSAVVAPAPAAPPSKCDRLADSVVATADSLPARAVELARRINRECGNDFDALFRAGRAINHIARFQQVKSHLELRTQAARLLGRAVTLRSKNAAAWLEYGVLLRKRGGIQVDAQRAVSRALALADEFPDSTPPALLAAINYQRGRYLQEWVDWLRNLKTGSALGVTTPACSNLGAFCENYTRPVEFNQHLKESPPIDPGVAAKREQAIKYLESAVRLDPANAEAAERYARELALGQEWERLDAIARYVAEQGTEPGFFGAVRAMAYERLGRYREADSLFRHAIPQLPDSLRRWYERPPPGLDTIPDFWTRVRPLWVTPFNEVQLEYWTRVTYALLVLRDREAEVIGPETPQGDALLRYGWPTMITQVDRNAAKILSGAQIDAANALGSCTPADVGGSAAACEPPVGGGFTSGISGGRWVFWTFAMDRPSLIFDVRPGAKVARYLLESSSEEYARQLRERSPLVFASKLVPKVFRLPVQVARFKGEQPGWTTAAFYGVVPAKQMELPAEDSVAVGLFVFRDTSGFPVVVEQRGEFVPGEALLLTYRLPLAAGRYAYTLEAFAPAFGGAAKVRDSLRAPTWDPDSLLVSDPVIAHRVETRTEGPTLTWRDLRIDASRTLTVAPGATLWVVWETYGLRPGAEGTAKYQVAVSLRDTSQAALPLRLLQRLGVARRPGPPGGGITLEWTSERPLAPDGRALESVSLQLPEDVRGQFTLVVTVTDPATGRTARASRPLSVVAP